MTARFAEVASRVGAGGDPGVNAETAEQVPSCGKAKGSLAGATLSYYDLAIL